MYISNIWISMSLMTSRVVRNCCKQLNKRSLCLNRTEWLQKICDFIHSRPTTIQSRHFTSLPKDWPTTMTNNNKNNNNNKLDGVVWSDWFQSDFQGQAWERLASVISIITTIVTVQHHNHHNHSHHLVCQAWERLASCLPSTSSSLLSLFNTIITSAILIIWYVKLEKCKHQYQQHCHRWYHSYSHHHHIHIHHHHILISWYMSKFEKGKFPRPASASPQSTARIKTKTFNEGPSSI